MTDRLQCQPLVAPRQPFQCRARQTRIARLELTEAGPQGGRCGRVASSRRPDLLVIVQQQPRQHGLGRAGVAGNRAAHVFIQITRQRRQTWRHEDGVLCHCLPHAPIGVRHQRLEL